MSVECTPPSLVSICSSPLSLSAILCYMCVHRSIHDLEIYHIISRTEPMSEAVGIFGRAIVGHPSNTHLKVWCLSAPLHHLCLLNFVPSVSRSVHDLEIYRILSRLESKSYKRGMLGRAVVGCPSNAHLQVWYLSAPLHHLCLLNFVPCVCIDPFQI